MMTTSTLSTFRNKTSVSYFAASTIYSQMRSSIREETTAKAMALSQYDEIIHAVRTSKGMLCQSHYMSIIT